MMESKKLTTRQYRLHDLLISWSQNHKEKMTNKDMLEYMDYEYGYTHEMENNPNRVFNNLTARKELSTDLDVVVRHEGFHKVYVGGRYATSQIEIEIYLLKKEIALKRSWRKLSIQKKKSGLNDQMSLQFTGYEKDTWESYIKDEEKTLAIMEKTYGEA